MSRQVTQVATHTLTKGMITDTDLISKDNQSYDYAENLRHTLDYESTIGSLANIKGLLSAEDLSGYNNNVVCAHVVIRDYLYLLLGQKNSSTFAYDKLLRLTIDKENKTLTDLTVLWGGITAAGELGLDKTKHTDIVGIYEADDNIKIYWATEGQPIKMANVATYLTNDGLIKSGSNSWLAPERFNIFSNTSLKSIEFSSLTVGTLYTGKVQYAYSLYKDKLQQSPVSPLTNMISLFADSTGNYSYELQGDSTSVDTGKGVILTLDLSAATDDVDYYDYIRVYRFHYTSYGQLPEVTIIGDYSIEEQNTIIDTGGTGLGTVTLEELIANSTSYSASTLAVKDNRLFAANISEDYFDVSGYDARAYRFNSSRIARLYPDYNSGVVEYEINGADPGTTTGGYIDWEDIPIDANCINISNNINNDYTSSGDYQYQTDGSTIGGEGVNVSYTFVTNGSLKLDNTGTDDNGLIYNSSTDYKNNATLTSYLGYQRGEVYRFGLVFYNAKGQKSKVQWVGDIRFPVYDSAAGIDYITQLTSGEVYAYPIGIEFSISTFPTDAISWELVRLVREKKDRSIVTTGMVNHFINYSGAHYGRYIVPNFNYDYLTTTRSLTVSSSGVSFISAEEAFQQSSNIKEDDIIDVVGVYNTYNFATDTSNSDTDFDFTSNGTDRNSIKYVDLQTFDGGALTASPQLSVLDNYYFIEDTSTVTTTLAEYPTYLDSGALVFYNYTINDYAVSSRAGLGGRQSLLILSAGVTALSSELASDFETTPATPTSNKYLLGYAYVKRDNPSRYNGFTYASRESNIYTSCGDLITVSTSTNTFYGGDTYINYFEYLHSMIIPGWCDGDQEFIVTTALPMESTINCSLRADLKYTQEYTKNFAYLMREHAGIHEYGSDEYIQSTDLYIYNNIYSQESTSFIYVSSNNVDLNTTFDSRIIYSDKKIYDEPIDSWAIFRPNNFIDVESTAGPIEVIRNFSNDLYFWQESAFGITPVNERSIITDANPGALALGIADVLSRYIYITRNIGTVDPKSVLPLESNLYWFDRNNKTIISYGGNQLVDLGKQKGLKVGIKDLMASVTDIFSADNFNYTSTYNPDFNEILFKFGEDNFLIYNTYFDVFSSVMTCPSYYTYNAKGVVFTHYDTTAGHLIFAHDASTVYCYYPNGTAQSPANSVLRITNSDNLPYTKVYDNISFFTYSKGSTGNIRNDQYFTKATFKNDYQFTAYDDNVLPTSDIELGVNLERKERGYSLAIPRNIVVSNGSTQYIDITAAANHSNGVNNPLRTFKERMRDKYLTIEFTYVNNQYLFVIPEIQFTYRYSKPNIG